MRLSNADLTHSPLTRPFEGQGARRRVAPFAVATLIALATVPLVHPHGRASEAGALLIFVAVAFLIVAAPWHRLPAAAQIAPPLIYIAGVALLRHVTGGSASPFTVLMTLPIVWLALYGSAPQIGICIAAGTLALGLPSLAFGEPAYSDRDLVRAMVLGVVAATLGFSVNRLLRALHEREDETRSILESAHESFVSVDERGRICQWNRQAELDFGHAREEAVAKDVVDLVVPESMRQAFRAELSDAVRTGRASLLHRRLQGRGLRRDGSEFPLEMTISPVETATGLRFNAFLHDISERHAAETQLQDAEERFRRAFDDAAIGMALTSPDGRWLRVNRALAEMTGRSTSDLTGLEFREITHPEDRDKDADALAALASGELERFQTEKRYFHANGSVLWISLNASAVRDPAGGVLYVIAQMQDVTERHAVQERLAHEASHDPLTALPNRTLLDDRMSMALARLRRSDLPLAVLFLDLDRFKLVNDSLGHDAGDRLLVEVASRLGGLLRPSDTVARLGGDEFAVLCEAVTPDGAATLARRIGECLAEPFTLDGQVLTVTSSIGIAMDRDPDVSPGTLLANADAAMYEAKTRGRSRYAFFATEMRTRASGRLEAESELREAVKSGGIEVYYQPQLELPDGGLVGVEALARWNHPERGVLVAAEFIPMAEESDLIIAVGGHVLAEAVADAERWREEVGDLRVTVNVSARQLTGPELPVTVANALARSGLPPHLLCLEMTDTTFADDPEGALEAMGDLRDLGVTLAIDEFGVGTSNLGLLRGMPDLQILKIDPSFIAGIEDGRPERELVSAVIHMAHALGMQVIAEGVETAAQAHLLQELGADAAQGNHLGPPVPAAALEPLLRRMASRQP